MRKYFCDRCKLEIEDPDKNLVRIEIQGRRRDCCSRSNCINAFNDLQTEIDDFARKGSENLSVFITSRFQKFMEVGENQYGEPQEATNGQ